MNTVIVKNCKTLFIGRRGENEVTEVLFDFSEWQEQFGAGVIDLYVKRNLDIDAYPVVLSVDGTVATWLVSAADTDVVGNGKIEYVYTVNEKIAKSAIFQFFVGDDIGESSPEPPEHYQSWLEQLTELGAETQANAQAAAQSASEAAESASEAAESASEAAESAAQVAEDSNNAEAWAVGERNGEPVSEGDPTYDNNAKYWAENARANAPVQSVNGEDGHVVLTLDDIPNGETYVRTTPEQLAQIATNSDDIADVKATADTALQPDDLRPYRTAAAQDAIDQSQNTMIGIAIQGKQAKITASGILKGDGAGGVSSAVAGTDYATPQQVSEKYTKPSSGIPSTDMTAAVQASLSKADTALQSAPVTSVNGQTGDVTIQPATDAQVTTAVNTWLGENVAQETGYVLDASLTMSNAAPPASAVGDLKSATNAISPILPVQYEWVEGAYLNVSGEVVESANFHYTSLIKVDPLYPVYRVFYSHTGGNSTTLRVHLYDSNGQWIKQLIAYNVSATQLNTFTTIYANGACYFRISCANDRIAIYDLRNLGGDGIKELQIEKANVVDRIGVFGKPVVDYIGKVQENSALTAKTSVFKNGNSYCIIYQENLDGTAIDVPSTSGSGVIALKYKYFTLSNGAETNVTYGTIAQKGTNYTDLNGNTAQFVGGIGKPARSGNYIYMTAAAPGTRRYNAINNYGMVCCRCSVSVSDSGVTFGNIEELSLIIDDVVGKLDVYRLNTRYQNYFIYYTLSPPCIYGQTWHWLLPVVNGFVHLDSSDGKVWTYKCTVDLPFQPYAEVSAKMVDATKMVFAIRGQKQFVSTVSGNFTYVGIFNIAGYIEHMYSLPGGICRPFILRINADQFYLLNNENDRNSCACYFIETVDPSRLMFYKVFEFFKRGTWYSGMAEESTINTLFLSGTDGPPTATTPSTFMLVDLPTPRTPLQVDFDII